MDNKLLVLTSTDEKLLQKGTGYFVGQSKLYGYFPIDVYEKLLKTKKFIYEDNGPEGYVVKFLG